MPETDAAPSWVVTRRRDRTGWVYLLDGDGLWWCPTFTRRWTLQELDGSEFGPTTAVDVDNVEALLADHARLTALLEQAHTTIRAFVAPGVPTKRGREYENGPIHHANDGCTDHV